MLNATRGRGVKKKTIIIIEFVKHSLNTSETLTKKDTKPPRLSRHGRH